MILKPLDSFLCSLNENFACDKVKKFQKVQRKKLRDKLCPKLMSCIYFGVFTVSSFLVQHFRNLKMTAHHCSAIIVPWHLLVKWLLRK